MSMEVVRTRRDEPPGPRPKPAVDGQAITQRAQDELAREMHNQEVDANLSRISGEVLTEAHEMREGLSRYDELVGLGRQARDIAQEQSRYAREARGRARVERWRTEHPDFIHEARELDKRFVKWLDHHDPAASQALRALEDGEGALFQVRLSSEALVFDEQGAARELHADGRENEAAHVADEDRLGLQLLRAGSGQASLTNYLETRFTPRPGSLAFEKIRALLEQDFITRRGYAPEPADWITIDERVTQLLRGWRAQAVERYAAFDSDDHLGKEAGERLRSAWLENRIMLLLRAQGALEHVNVRPAALDQDPINISLLEEQLDESPAIDTVRVLAEMASGSPTPAPLEESVTEAALLSILLNDVGGNTEAYRVDQASGLITKRNTGQGFSMAAEWMSELPERLRARMHKSLEVSGHIGQSLGFQSVPFEIAELRQLAVSERTRLALHKLATELRTDGELTKLMRGYFLTAFPNPLVAYTEYEKFLGRLDDMSKLPKFGSPCQTNNTLQTYRRNLHHVVGRGGLAWGLAPVV